MANGIGNNMKDNAPYLDKLCEELRLRKYSKQTEKAYLNTIKNFLAKGKPPREYLLCYADKSSSSIRSVYFALKFFYENVLNEKFNEKSRNKKESYTSYFKAQFCNTFIGSWRRYSAYPETVGPQKCQNFPSSL